MTALLMLCGYMIVPVQAAKAALTASEMMALKKMLQDPILESDYIKLIEANQKKEKLGEIDLPKSDVLDQAVTSKVGAGIGCNDPKLFTCDEKYRVSYADYIKSKLRLKAQIDLINSGQTLDLKFSKFYDEDISNDNSYGGKAYAESMKKEQDRLSQGIITKLDDREKKRWSWSNLGNLLADSSVQSTKMVGSAVKFDAQLLTGLARIQLQSMRLNPEYADSVVKAVNQYDVRKLEDIQGKYDFVQANVKILSEAFDGKGTLLNNPERLQKLLVDFSAEVVKMSDKDRDNALGEFVGLKKAVDEYNELVKLKKELSDPKYSNVINAEDLKYIDSALSKAGFDVFFASAKFAKSAIQSIPGFNGATGWINEVSNIIEAADNFRQAYSEASGFFDEQNLRLSYRRAQAQAELNQIYLDAFTEVSTIALNKFSQYLDALNTSSSESSWYAVNLMQSQLTSITQGGSSHIGSAAYYIGRSPNSDSVDTSDAIRVQNFSGANSQPLQQKAQYTDGFILKPPVDVTLQWTQTISQPLDLDSHLTGPSALGNDSSVRFHVYWNERGSLTTAPNVLLYRDAIPDTGINLDRPEQTRLGAEQTRIGVPGSTISNGVYRFYVNNYSSIKQTPNGIAAGELGLSNSGARVEVFNAGTEVPKFDPNNPAVQGVVGTSLGGEIRTPTNQSGNVWYVFQLDSRTGILRRVDRFGTVTSPRQVPLIGESR